MPRILVLFENVENIRENNHMVVLNALHAEGVDVYAGKLSSLRTSTGEISCLCAQITRPVRVGENLGAHIAYYDAEKFDFIWLLNQPHAIVERETYQILWRLSLKASFVNSIEAVMLLNNKNNIQVLVPDRHVIEGFCSNSFEFLWQTVKENPGKWVAKPASDGCGADVYVISREETNSRAILQSMTGNALSKYEIHGRTAIGNVEKYCLLQKFVPQAADNEKRVIIAGGQVIGAYGKIPNAEDHRSNKTQGNEQYVCHLNDDEMRLCKIIAQNCQARGILFAGIDVAYPYVFELNLVNPGGLLTLSRLNGEDFGKVAVKSVLAALQQELHDAAA